MTLQRPAPPLTQRTGDYWRSGADRVLRIARCQACGFRLHPPRPVCPRCRGREIAFEPVSGQGVIWSWTVNRYPWSPGMTPPYVIAEVELVEQPGLRILSNIVDCQIDQVRIGLPVTVAFDHVDEAYIPVFRP